MVGSRGYLLPIIVIIVETNQIKDSFRRTIFVPKCWKDSQRYSETILNWLPKVMVLKMIPNLALPNTKYSPELCRSQFKRVHVYYGHVNSGGKSNCVKFIHEWVHNKLFLNSILNGTLRRDPMKLHMRRDSHMFMAIILQIEGPRRNIHFVQ